MILWLLEVDLDHLLAVVYEFTSAWDEQGADESDTKGWFLNRTGSYTWVLLLVSYSLPTTEGQPPFLPSILNFLTLYFSDFPPFSILFLFSSLQVTNGKGHAQLDLYLFYYTNHEAIFMHACMCMYMCDNNNVYFVLNMYQEQEQKLSHCLI